MREHRTANLRLVLAVAAAAAFAAPAAAETVVVLTGRDIAVVDTESQAPVPPSAVHEITGLLLNDRIASIDTRTTTGVLYGFAQNRLYTIDPATGVATLAGPRADTGIPGATDFDPASGLLRMVSFRRATLAQPDSDERSSRLDPDTMRLVAVDPTYAEPYEPYSRTLVYAPGDPGVGSVPQITTIAHDPSASGALYGIDSARSTLVRIGAFGAAPDSNEAQRVHTVAPLTGLPDGATVYALEITSDGTALALSRLSWRTGVSRIDLTTGEATVLRDLADPIVDAIDLALAPTATLPAASALDVRLARVRTVYSPGNTYESIDVRGSISLLPGDLAGNSLRVDVGGAVVEFTIRRTGRAAWVGVAGRGRDSIRLRAVRLRGGDRRIDYVMRLQPNFSDNRNKMELMPGGLGPFVSYVGLSFDGATFVATTQFQKVAKRFGSR